MKPLLLAGYIAAFAGDAITTDQGLARGGREMVLPTQSRPVATALFAGQAALGYVVYRRVRVSHPKLARLLYTVVVTVHGTATVWNLHQLSR